MDKFFDVHSEAELSAHFIKNIDSRGNSNIYISMLSGNIKNEEVFDKAYSYIEEYK